MKKRKSETADGQSTTVVTKSVSEKSHSLKKKKKKKKSKFKIQDSEISTTTDIKQELPVPLDKIKKEKTESKNEIRNKLSVLWLNYKPRSTTLVKSGITWFEQLIDEGSDEVLIDLLTKKDLKGLASKILTQDAENYKKVEERSAQKGDMNFRKTVYNVGTFRDKLAAHVLRCMESPAHSLHNLTSIILMISPKAKNEFEEALDSVQKLLDFTLLPDKKVARKFEDHKFSCLLPLLATNREQAEKQLALWYFEDQLLLAYRRLISQLAEVTSNSVDNTKITGIKSLINLVTKHPGQNAEIVLEAIINKLGDPSRKVASQTMYSLHRFLQQCPLMKESVVNLVEILLYRPNVSPKTQYYSLCYLKDIIFKSSDSKLAAKLLKLYIGFFKACTKKGEVDTRMMAALLRGINRAFPFSRLQGEALQEQLQTLYKLCHIVNFAVATQALQLIYQVVTSKDQVEDRFYQALYGQLHDPTFSTSTGSAAFLNLLFKAMVRDDSLERRQAFVKRLLQVAQYQAPNVVCGMLFLVSEIAKEKPDLKEFIRGVMQSLINSNDPDDFETFEDVDEEETFEDVDGDDIDPDVKEDVEESNPRGRSEIKSDEFKQDLDEDKDTSCTKPTNIAAPLRSSWFHCTNTSTAKTLKRDFYDPYLRTPQYCGAQFTSLWELLLLQAHYHPSVAVFAEKIITGELVTYSGDPLQDFTLIRFLDRFVYKNPKKDVEKMSSSAATFGSKAYYTPDGARGIAVNSEDFIKLQGEEVPEDQKFFHSYFTKFKAEKRKEKDDDEGSVDDDEFDEYLNKMSGVGSDESDLDEDIDFSAGTANTPKASVDDVMESDEDGGASGDEEPVFGGFSDDSVDDEEFGNEEDDMDFDEENVAFSDNDDDFGGSSTSSKKKAKSKKKSKNESDSLESMFASADDYAHLIEENAEDEANLPTATSRDLANKDRAHAKQLNWEVDRNDRLKDRGRYGNRGQWKKRGQSKPFRGPGGQKHFKKPGKGPKSKFNFKSRGSFKAKRGRRK